MIVRPLFKIVLLSKKVWQRIILSAIWSLLLSSAFLELKSLFFTLWIIGLVILVYVHRQMADSTLYTCLDDKIQMTRTFPVFFQKEILYQDIKEMLVQQRAGEAFSGLKSIHLLTHASGSTKSGSSFPGMIVGSLKAQDAEDVHIFLREKIRLSRKESR
jgi:hypothetical protein